jgi:F-type H+-transporting ATPase subunit delta
MAEALTLARPYAEAAFKLARESSSLPAWADALARLASVAQSSQMVGVLGNPRLSDKQVAGVVSETAGTLTDIQKNFVTVLAQNERLNVLPQIASHFEGLKSGAEGSVNAEVSSAYPLSNEQLADIVVTLEKKYGKKVHATVVVDASLIGGVSIRVGDEVTDVSIRGKLAQLRTSLLA